MTQPRRRSTLKIVLIVLASFLVLCCGGGAVAAYFGLNAVTKAPKAATEAFLDDLERGDTAAAYDKLCGSVKNGTTQEQFATLVDQERPTSHDISWGGDYSNTNGVERASLTAEVTYSNGTTDKSRAFELVKEGGAWKLCGTPY